MIGAASTVPRFPRRFRNSKRVSGDEDDHPIRPARHQGPYGAQGRPANRHATSNSRPFRRISARNGRSSSTRIPIEFETKSGASSYRRCTTSRRPETCFRRSAERRGSLIRTFCRSIQHTCCRATFTRICQSICNRCPKASSRCSCRSRSLSLPPVEIAAQLAVAPATIGEFYTALSNAFHDLSPVIDQNAHAIELPPNVFRINSVDDARGAIDKIKGEGEGAPGNPDQPANPDQLAHYYVFKEISVGNELRFDPTTQKLVPVAGKQLRFPGIFRSRRPRQYRAPSTTFNALLKQLLTDLEACWTTGADFADAALLDMANLKAEGAKLISRGIRPEFVWPA